MQRRDFLIGVAASAAAAGPASAADNPLRAAAREAYFYVSPMMEIATVRTKFLDLRARPGHLYGQDTLPTPTTQSPTMPECDMFYSQGFVDLSHGPAFLKIPPLGGRYACLAVIDMFGDTIAVSDPRDAGPRGDILLIVGPKTENAPAAAIRSPTPWVWVVIRVHVDGPHDVDSAAHVLEGFGVAASEGGWAVPGAARTAPWPAYFGAAHHLLGENPPPAGDHAVLERIAPLGLVGGGFDAGRFKGDDAAAIAAGVDDARASLRGVGSPEIRGGWVLEPLDTGNFGQDYETRARVAFRSLVALPPAEAIYLFALADGASPTFDGAGPWRLTFPAGGAPPVDAFWSLALYVAGGDAQPRLAANPIDRYAIGDRTPGLAHDPDGGLTLWISRADPGGARTANWLPAPAKGPFSLILRAFLPKADLISRAYLPPPVVRA